MTSLAEPRRTARHNASSRIDRVVIDRVAAMGHPLGVAAQSVNGGALDVTAFDAGNASLGDVQKAGEAAAVLGAIGRHTPIEAFNARPKAFPSGYQIPPHYRAVTTKSTPPA